MTRKRYSREPKIEAVKMDLEQGLPVTQFTKATIQAIIMGCSKLLDLKEFRQAMGL